MYTNLNLKAADEAALTQALLDAGFKQDEESGSAYHEKASVLMLPEGSITTVVGTTLDENGNNLDLYEVVKGYHCNVRTEDAELVEKLQAITVDVATPKFVWAV